jgi:hypothetical protein
MACEVGDGKCSNEHAAGDQRPDASAVAIRR